MTVEKPDGSLELEAPYRFGDQDVEPGWQSLKEVCRLSVSDYPEGALVCD